MRPESFLQNEWREILDTEFNSQYYQDLMARIEQRAAAGENIFPVSEDIFSALNQTSLQNVRVVIVGQDPYHGAGQAHGLSFSVKEGVRFPPSLRNILKELQADLGCEIPSHGSLQKWAAQGVLLLNAVLTVEEGKANSHQGWGWERFTDRIIHLIDENCKDVVFVLWGSYAQKKASFVNRQKHYVIEGVHPSPLSAHRGFHGSRPFSKINNHLVQCGLSPIDWSLA